MLSESTPNSEERERLIAVVARTFAGWNEDTEDGDLTAHWEKVNATCLREAAKIADAVLAAGYRPQETTDASWPVWIQGDRAIGYVRSLHRQIAERDAVIEKAHAVIHGGSAPEAAQILADAMNNEPGEHQALATTGGETEWEYGCISSSHTPLNAEARRFDWIEDARSHEFECASPAIVRRRKAGPWVAVDPTSRETTERGN